MAEIHVVMVHGAAFAGCTTEPNAVMLRNKINKMYAGDPATIADEPALYNPKHVDALARLDGMGLIRVGEETVSVAKRRRPRAA